MKNLMSVPIGLQAHRLTKINIMNGMKHHSTAMRIFGNIEDTIWLGNFKLFISSPFEQQTNIVFSFSEVFNLLKTPERY